MNIADESRKLFNECKRNAQKGFENLVPYASGSANKKTRMYKIAKRYREDAEIDFELGILNKEEYALEIKAVQLFERMLANYNIY